MRRWTPAAGAIDKYGECLPQESLEKCLKADSVLLGAVGGPKWEQVDKNNRPEKALLRIRSAMGLYANLRPAKIFSQLSHSSPLKQEIVEKGIDFVIVRELIGGIYFGAHETVTKQGENAPPILWHTVNRRSSALAALLLRLQESGEAVSYRWIRQTFWTVPVFGER